MSSPSEFQVDRMRVVVHATRDAMGRAAAGFAARKIADRQRDAPSARVVFAAAPSQDEFLATLAASPEVDWSRLVALHMDEYLGLPASHPASFRLYLRDHLFDRVRLPDANLRLIPADSPEWPARIALDYERELRSAPIDLVCGGIGENGHLAFNDPPVADAHDPCWVKTVRLDEACRLQQVHDGCFPRIDDVPRHAFTLTLPALLSAPHLAITVPGPRKAEAVRATLLGPISEACPASFLRLHPGACLFLDRESARLL